jgi:hypothetical protein
MREVRGNIELESSGTRTAGIVHVVSWERDLGRSFSDLESSFLDNLQALFSDA